MDSNYVLKEALKLVRAAMKREGYSAKGMVYFQRSAAGNTMVLSLQKSTKSNSSQTLIAVNYGVYSKLVGEKMEDEASAAVDIARAHWRKRFAIDGREAWLPVRADMTAREAADLLLEGIQSSMTELEGHSTDEALRDEWFQGLSPGITPVQRALFLAIVVHEIGPHDRLPEVFDEIQRLKTHASAIERDLADIGVSRPR